nr:protein SAAL1-like [Chelonoidis abingdonii]
MLDFWKMDRNSSPPSSDTEDEQAAGDSIGNTVYSKHWLFSILTKLIEVISSEKSDSNSNHEEVQTELDEEMENDICKMWDMSMDEVCCISSSKNCSSANFQTTEVLLHQKRQVSFFNCLHFINPILEPNVTKCYAARSGVDGDKKLSIEGEM